MKFGAHMSISGGLYRAFDQAEQVGSDTLQIFSKNQQQWRARTLMQDDIARFKAAQERTGIGPVVVHDSYLINLAASDPELWEKSCAAFTDELERAAALGCQYLVTHPGAHVGSGEEAGLERVAQALNRILNANAGPGTMVLLETTASQGTTLGYRFEHLAALRAHVDQPERVGVCVDTCHILAAGYDIRTPEGYAAVFTEFDQIIGLEHLKVFHLNDSLKPFGSRVDRHTHIGEGAVGLEAFRLIVNDSRFAGLPMILETPKGDDLAEDRTNLATLRGLIRQP